MTWENLIFSMRHIFIFLLCSTHIYCFSQQWVKTYDMGYEANWIIEDYDKGYIILGTNSNVNYGLIIKTDVNGNVLWKIHIGNGLYEVNIQNVERTEDNGLILGGTSSKYANQEDAFILKLNSCGKLDWCSDIYTPTFYDLGVRVKPTKDHGYVFLGLLNNPDPKLRTNLFKFDLQGNLLWHQKYLPDSAAFFDDAADVLVDSTGYFITASCYYPDPGGSGGYERFYFIKSDLSGNKLWSSIYGNQTYYYGYPYNNSLVSNHGNYYSFGKHDVISSGEEHPAFVKIMQNGTQSYNRDILSNVSQGAASSGIFLNDTSLVVSCCFNLSIYNDSNKIVKIDTLGSIINTFNLPNITTACIFKMAKTFDEKCIIATTNCPSNCQIVAYKINSDLQWDSIYTRPFTYDSLCPHQIISDTIDPGCNLVVNVEEPISNPETHQMHLFPNPTKGKLTIMLPKYLVVTDKTPPVQSRTIYHQWRSTILLAYDLNGNQVFSQEIMKDQSQLELDVSSWSKGMYYFKLVYNGNSVDGKKVIVE